MSDIDNTVTVYTTPTCGFCHMLKEYLEGKGVKYETKDITEDETAYKEILEKTGQLGVPAMIVGEKSVIGFDRPKIDAILREAKLV